jgi:hypothetical protein
MLKKKDSSGLGKKKKVSTEMVVVDSSKPVEKKKKKLKAHSPKAIEKAKNKLVAKEAEIEQELQTLEIPKGRTPDERRMLEEYSRMLYMNSQLIKRMKKKLKENLNSKDIYALSTLMSQQREVIADIRSVSDMSGQVATLEANMLQPMVRSIGQNMLDSFYQLRKLIIETSKPNETQFALQKLDEITKEQGKFLHMQYGDAVGKISQIMMG